MPRASKITGDGLLHALLDKLEDPKERARDIIFPINYLKVGGPSCQDNFHRALEDAAARGAIALERKREGRFTGEYARARLIDPDRLYAFLNRRPSKAIAAEARAGLVKCLGDIAADNFFAGLLAEAEDAWRANKSFVSAGPQDAEALAMVMRLAHGILHIDERGIDHRTFSRRTVRDSKALERNEGRVAQILKRTRPDLGDDEARDVLAAFGIIHRAHALFLKGPVNICRDGLSMQGTGSAFIGLTWQSVREAELLRPVDYVITIENATSFWRYCQEVDGNYLAMLTEGFPARDVLAGMTHLVRQARRLGPAPIFHWGDIDAGGLRIAAHLEDAFGTSLRLHAMDPELALKSGHALDEKYGRIGIERLSSRSGDIGLLAAWLMNKDALGLEQEELDPEPPLLG